MDSGNFSAFHKFSEILREELISADLKGDIRNHFNGLQDEFERYFPEINTEEIEMVLTRDPISVKWMNFRKIFKKSFWTHKQHISEN